MIYFEKDKLPAQLHDAVITIEWSQDSNFVKAYKDPNDGWRIVFDTIFNNPGGFNSVEQYLEKQFDLYDDNHSYFEELCVEDDQQIIYLKDGSVFE